MLDYVVACGMIVKGAFAIAPVSKLNIGHPALLIFRQLNMRVIIRVEKVETSTHKMRQATKNFLNVSKESGIYARI